METHELAFKRSKIVEWTSRLFEQTSDLLVLTLASPEKLAHDVGEDHPGAVTNKSYARQENKQKNEDDQQFHDYP
jgi:hypothetical protein